MIMETILLEKFFVGNKEVNNDTFTQVFKNNEFYIYKRGKYLFEVFERKTVPLCVNFANRIYSETERKEVYPKTKDFGVWAWCCGTIENAMKYVNQKQYESTN